MSIKSKLLAGAAALTLVSGLGIAATAGTAMAATPSCGHECVNLFQARFGTTFLFPSFVTDVYKQGQHVGQPIIEFRASNSDPAEDWTVANVGTVSEFLAAGLVSPSLALHYGCVQAVNFPTCPDGKTTDLAAFENEYAPFGADSGLCMGVAATATAGEGVTLQPCGVSSKTIWVIDLIGLSPASAKSEQIDPIGIYGVPLINGSDTNFSHPFVLTYNGEPTAFPRAQAYVTNLTGFSNNSPFNIFSAGDISSLETISDAQQWLAFPGVLP
jgi:hypothetical protein